MSYLAGQETGFSSFDLQGGAKFEPAQPQIEAPQAAVEAPDSRNRPPIPTF